MAFLCSFSATVAWANAWHRTAIVIVVLAGLWWVAHLVCDRHKENTIHDMRELLRDLHE